jgi:hypothetical protein
VAAGTYGIDCALSTIVSTPGDRRDTVLRGNCDVLVTGARQIERCDVSRPAAFGRGFFTPHTGFARETTARARHCDTPVQRRKYSCAFESDRDACSLLRAGYGLWGSPVGTARVTVNAKFITKQATLYYSPPCCRQYSHVVSCCLE